MKIETFPYEEWVVCRVKDDFTQSYSLFIEKVEKFLQKGSKKFIIDLSQAPSLNIQNTRLLAKTGDRLQMLAHAQVVFLLDNPEVTDSLGALCKEDIPIFSSLEQLRASA